MLNIRNKVTLTALSILVYSIYMTHRGSMVTFKKKIVAYSLVNQFTNEQTVPHTNSDLFPAFEKTILSPEKC